MAVEHGDIADGLGRALDLNATLQATRWITDAYLLIETRFGPGITTTKPDLVDYVVRESVVARFRRLPLEGYTSVTTTVDDGSVTRRRDTPDEGGDGWLIDGRADLLAPRSANAGAFSVRPSFVPDGPCLR